MKTFSLFLFSIVILLSSCSKDDPTNFAGNYSGTVTCAGADSVIGAETSFVITLNTDGSYTLNIDNESSFTCTAEDNVLTIAKQKPNGGAEFEPFLEGTFTENEDGTFTLVVTVDEDGEITNCTANMTKP